MMSYSKFIVEGSLVWNNVEVMNMERKGFVIPDFIYDTFNLSLYEADQGSDYYIIE